MIATGHWIVIVTDNDLIDDIYRLVDEKAKIEMKYKIAIEALRFYANAVEKDENIYPGAMVNVDLARAFNDLNRTCLTALEELGEA